MKRFAKYAAAAVIALGASTVAANAACNGDASTETVLGAGSGALVGGLASNSIAGAAIGGVAGGLIGNAIGQSNNREDCRREAYYYNRDRDYAYNSYDRTYDRTYERTYDRAPDGYVDRRGNYVEYPDD